MSRRKTDILTDENGTALMEFVLVMPLLVFMIFCTIQLALVCMAKQMTHYAAYSAARAALVYNPRDYSDPDGSFFMSGGPVHRAACTALAWMAQLPSSIDSDASDPLVIPGWGPVPGSGFLTTMPQVGIDDLNSGFLPDIPAVKVTVQFLYPLYIPMAGPLIAYFSFKRLEKKAEVEWSSAGLVPSDIMQTLDNDSSNNGARMFFLRETCIMPMPWDTRTFPRSGKDHNLGTDRFGKMEGY
ncbi:MAG: pilus assembly protein [Victivallales bacterium]|nr:pilus assembly protein [Victivallales bacterium]